MCSCWCGIAQLNVCMPYKPGSNKCWWFFVFEHVGLLQLFCTIKICYRPITGVHGEININGVKVPGNESSRERKGWGAKVQGSELAREGWGEGVKVPGSELPRVLLADSLQGANWPGSVKARYRSPRYCWSDCITVLCKSRATVRNTSLINVWVTVNVGLTSGIRSNP